MKRLTTILMILLLCTAVVQAQKVRGNVYGGGNKGAVGGNTTVTVYSGEVNNAFGGARMADVGGRSFVNIDGENASENITISSVYGGNDIAGTIGQSGEETTVPTELKNVLGPTETKEDQPKKNAIDNTWKTFVTTSRSSKVVDSETVEDKWITIGSLFGGGNGEYQYEEVSSTEKTKTYDVYQIPKEDGDAAIATITVDKDKSYLPELDKTYLEIKGGNIAHVYGGGNNATVKVNTTINIDNKSDDCDKFITAYATASGLSVEHIFASLKSMSNLNTFQSDITSFAFNHARVFGGNNKAEMAIRPTWNLQQGIIRDLYSGGNQGLMTSPEGLLLEIDPAPINTTTTPDATKNDNELTVENVFGGCRMADVKPTLNGEYAPVSNLPGYKFPSELSARVLVRGGHITNVYGGNDITGKVYGGNAIGIYTTIYGDVYGGGNGAYAYTNQSSFENSPIYGDYYYSTAGYASPYAALNAHRPNAEQVSIRLKGTDAQHPTIIKGSVFVGGNCASLSTVKNNPLVELKIGSYVVADKVFLGNNGEKMVDPTVLSYYAGKVDDAGNIDATGTDYCTNFSLTNSSNMAAYMDGAAMTLQPRVVFDDTNNGDPATYEPNSSYVGSFYCGGNIGSMIIPGKNTYSISRELNIFEKFVGGCNNAYVPVKYAPILDASGNPVLDDYGEPTYDESKPLNAVYDGGVLGTATEQSDYTEGGKIKDRLQIDLENLTITPLRWNEDQTRLIWNTNKWDNDENDFIPVPNSPVDKDTRLLGGNVYGGCFSSGHVNGNIIININEDVLNRDAVFGTGTIYGNQAAGIDYDGQRNDVMAVALSVFGGGCGEDTEVWGSASVNLNNGYAFQIFGGGEKGVVGKKNAGGKYEYNPAYSTIVNLNGVSPVYTSERSDNDPEGLAETEFIYGGGNEGDVCGNTYVNLGNGRVYDAFGGASDADILGHTEIYIGRQPNGSGGYKDGFPWVKDIVYGGNDFGGTIQGEYENGFDYVGRIRNYAADGGSLHGTPTNDNPGLLKSASYVEYLQGRVDTIFGGSYGNYDYTLEKYKDEEGNSPTLPYQESSFVNIRPHTENKSENRIIGVFGGGTGYPGNRDGDRSQNRSYVLVDIPDNLSNFRTTEFFGAGSYNGMGMNSAYDPISKKTIDDGGDPIENLDKLSAIIDLVHGKVGAAYGGSFMEGVTRRTMVNVPRGSTINIGSIFGGAYGKELLAPCDVYEAHVNYSSTDAILVYNEGNELMKGAIYGGNNTCRRTLYGFIDIDAPVWQQHPKYGKTRATVYGAGCGPMTWSEYTEVNLNKKPDNVVGDYAGAEVFEVYGGAQNGEVLNAESAKSFMNKYLYAENLPEYLQAIYDAKGYNSETWTNKIWPYCWTLGKGYYYPYTESGTFDFNTKFDGYSTNEATNLSNPLVCTEEMDDRSTKTYKYNTNVRIHDGAYVANYAYGGGLGSSSMPGSGDVYGTTYIALLGGEVNKDIYAAGTIGVVYDNYESGEFIASSNAFIQGGMCRNVYGGGWEGNVGKHTGDLSAPYYDFTNNKALDIYGETHVVIGDVNSDASFADGKPAIQRNVYGGGEGGSVFGTTHLTINNGMIGYRWKDNTYVEELDDKEKDDNLLDGSGNAFGGGYILNSYVDNTNVKMYGGQIRGSLFGGGEVGPVGRGTMKDPTNYTSGILNGKARIFKAGKTHVEMYNGHVLRNVFGGGRGKDSWDGDGTYSMDAAIVATLDHDSKGFVFGQTEVNIYGGEVGTDEGMARSFGNVFGGGDEGTVYSAYEKSDGTLGYGEKIGVRYGDDAHEGYYFKKENGAFITETVAGETHNVFTEDCKVLVEPWLQVKKAGGLSYGGKTYAYGDYIPTAYLNTLKAKSGNTWPSDWDDVDVGENVTVGSETVFKERGIVIHNAVFAGGNIAFGSNSMNANEITVFGNATASIHDVYNRDFITIGTGHTGGLYGDGNLTFVDGYRELNITNYGTDKYHLASPLTIAQYKNLPGREQAYYEPKYECAISCTDNEGTTYSVGSSLPYDELTVLFLDANGQSLKDGETPIMTWNSTTRKWIPNSSYWIEKGVVSTYAGRIMNTIQRADFCGVFGSRMVMKGARDRVPDKEDSKLYTINRVREVSLNKMEKADETGDDKMHGNYFGIYSNVNYFGALTSDVDFYNTVRTTNANLEQNSALAPNSPTETFKEWKESHINDRTRNNGNCHNQLALASGVFLELTTEKSTGPELRQKDWGLITGVVELDLINVQTGVGGGFVYAKNQHGQRKAGHQNTTLTALNAEAVSKWNWDYETDDSKKEEWETSGNFIHSSQTIIDDCYNESARYLGTSAVPAHYWFISGQVYVYDQYITAHTGASNAYSETVELPITINAASNGKMTLMDVQPNLYAYYSSYTNTTTNTKLSGDAKVVINNTEYYLNDPISYWDWNKLPLSQKKLFVEETYVLKDSCYINSKYYPAGYVMLPGEYDELSGHAVSKDLTPTDGINNPVLSVKKATKNAADEEVVAKDDDDNDIYVAFADAFRPSNNLSHDTGYLLVYNVNNPEIWKPWYTPITGDSRSGKITSAAYTELPVATTTVENVTTLGRDAYYNGPTYTPTETGLYGQKEYDVNDIIPKEIYDDYYALSTGETTSSYIPKNDPNRKQAEFVPAHIVTKEYVGTGVHYYPGAPVDAEISGYTAPAYVCTSTIELSPTEYIYVNDLMTGAEKEKLKTDHSALAADIEKYIVPAYYCTKAGLYGGDVYVEGQNYRALGVWSSMSEAEREKFTFNYDALDLLIDPTYGNSNGTRQKEGQKYQYDGYDSYSDANKDNMIYSLSRPIDYTATYNSSTDMPLTSSITVKRSGSDTSTSSVQKNDELTRSVFESLPNEQRHYAPITVKAAEVGNSVYVVHEGFVHIETPYAVGTTIDSDAYSKLTSEEQKNITELTFTEAGTYFYCREAYKVNEKGEGQSVKAIMANSKGRNSLGETVSISANQEITSGNEVPVGVVIAEGATDSEAYSYKNLPNKQKNFTIHGISPMETSTLYVSRNSDINDLSTEKIITVIYKYDYEESDVSGLHVTPVSERHIVNIHIKFESGVPIIADIKAPGIVLPGTSITMRVPTVTPGAYVITGGGWELFENDAYADSHTNGIPYKPAVDSLYWYQDGYLIAYYAKTYLGKTYSNAVPVSVANYHDLKKVMDDKKYHLHVDYDRSQLKRDSKIYINDYSSSSENGLDLFKDFYDLSLLHTGDPVDGHVVTTDTKTGLISSGSFEGHAPLNTDATNGVKAGKNLEFFLRTDITREDDPAVPNEWTSIASGENEPCFNGNFHGDGHTISGLDNSLFGKLCGNVYNLGVTGSFTSAGVADEGDGYVESSWVKTSSSADLSGIKAVFGGSSTVSHEQTVNCYYPSSNAYDASSKAKSMPDHAFYDGEVAYDLNNFYLYKRYNDNAKPGGSTSYKYWLPGNDAPQTGTYATNAANCSSGYNGIKYVEDRYADGDYRFAAGTIPTTDDDRHYVEVTENPTTHLETRTDHYYPIWPDDYLFFGQMLTFGYSDTETHQALPSSIVKDDNNRLTESSQNNRVYRAPAYYGNSTMGVAHFNPNVYLAQKSKDGAKEAYPGMTAIDFAGHNNAAYALGRTDGKFYPPLLDDDGLLSISNIDETRNLLVYAPAADVNAKTHGVLTDYFVDPVYNDYYDNSDGYRLVRKSEMSIYGHLVQSNLIATNDHLLVDKQDFNCPIGYHFLASSNTADGTRMWYQRMPEKAEYVAPVWTGTPAVRSTKGWQGVSIPFTAELVTTNEKGEITHFYSGSETSKNGTGTKIGHEYWLREFKDGGHVSATDSKVYEAMMTYPDAAGDNKRYTNTFLWDYYYSNSSVNPAEEAGPDKNDDTYQRYYKTAHTHSDYPLLAGAKPYILGLPGDTYYEFDLSGNFVAQNTKNTINKLGQQIITFASDEGTEIKVSDTELSSVGNVTHGGYTFKANYMNQELNNGNFVMNSDGNAYYQLSDNNVKKSQYAFRPYFVASGSARDVTRSIVFSGEIDNETVKPTMPHETDDPGTLIVSSGKHKVIVTSTLNRIATVRIVNTAGITLSTFDIEPGQTIDTRVNNSGVYIVQTTDGKFIKKLAVK